MLHDPNEQNDLQNETADAAEVAETPASEQNESSDTAASE